METLFRQRKKMGTEKTLITTYCPDESHVVLTDLTDLPTTRVELRDTDAEHDESIFLREKYNETPKDRSERFEVIGEIGKGGMGAVFKAIQATIGRQVALKVTHKQDRRSLSFFLSEARVTGRLEHANIVPVHSIVCNPDNQPSIVMKLIKGTSWRELLHSRERVSLTLKDHLRILLSVCNAVAYAHEQGILHRDLKPENIMVGEFGQVFVMDWGLAVNFFPTENTADGIVSSSQVQHVAGTPGYMAPELSLGMGSMLNRQTDVYLLGACLHEVLTGRLRHQGKNVKDVLQAAVESRPIHYDDSVPHELADICNRATNRDPQDRYSNVQKFAKAVEGFLEHEQAAVITAKALELVDRLKKLTSESLTAPPELREDLEPLIYQLHGEAGFAFKHALEIWPEGNDGVEGLKTLSTVMMEHALSVEDLNLVMRLVDEVDDPMLIKRVKDLRVLIESRDRELQTLRKKTSQSDWTAIARPLGFMLMMTGFLGGIGITGSYVLRHIIPQYDGPFIRFALWIPVILGIGTVGLKQFGKVRFAGSLFSSQTLGTWGAILVAAVFVELINLIFGHPNYHLVGVHTLLFGVGIASLAFQTRMWLLLPASIFYAASLFSAVYASHAREILGLLVFFVIGGIGLAFRLGFILDTASGGNEKGSL
ncbi:MAG: protein kinase [Desulfobulbaceae bacterium]|nr:protein kinase [Desulfobulbaceae bacterium]